MVIIRGLLTAFSLLMLWSVLAVLIGSPLKSIAGSNGATLGMLLAIVLTLWIYVKGRNQQSTNEIDKYVDKYALPTSDTQIDPAWQIVQPVKRETSNTKYEYKDVK